MKLKQLILTVFFFTLCGFSVAASPTLDLHSTNTAESINITLTVKSAKNINGIQYIGLNSLQVISREVAFNTSSANESNNAFVNKLTLAPTKAESTIVYAVADIDGKKVTSNKVSLVITPKQLSDYQKRQQQLMAENKKRAAQIQKQINQQLQAQQKYFNDMSAIMKKQQEDVRKAQQQLYNSLNKASTGQ